MMRTLWGDDGQERFEDVYFSQFDGYYFTGDGSTRDEDGYYWVTGRVDDILLVSGHNIGTAEVESACVLNENVAECAVVGFPHPIKGNAIYCFVTLNEDVAGDDALKKALADSVTREVGRFAVPDVIQWAPGLPKTRSGKIMRRVLRQIADPKSFKTMTETGDLAPLGDVSTLADPLVVDSLMANGAHGKL
jgi:acetyl-CoA synthetase